jgi:hypothetical protein
MSLLLSVLLSVQALAATTLSCNALFLSRNENESIRKEIALSAVQLGGCHVRHEATLEGKYLSVMEEPNSDELLTQIVHEPTYTIGSVNRASLSKSGRLSLSEVNGATVHRIECQRK